MGNSESRCKSCQSCSFCDRGNGLCICYCRDEVTCSCKCNVGKAHDVLQKLASIAGGAVLVVGGAALAVGSGGVACPILGVLGGMVGGAGLSSTIHGAVKAGKGEKISASEYFVDVGVGFVTGAVGSGGAVATEKLAENLATTAAKEFTEEALVKGGTKFAARLVTDAVELGAGTVVRENVAKELATTVAKKVTEEAVVKGGTKFAVHMAGGAATSLASTAVQEAGTCVKGKKDWRDLRDDYAMWRKAVAWGAVAGLGSHAWSEVKELYELEEVQDILKNQGGRSARDHHRWSEVSEQMQDILKNQGGRSARGHPRWSQVPEQMQDILRNKQDGGNDAYGPHVALSDKEILSELIMPTGEAAWSIYRELSETDERTGNSSLSHVPYYRSTPTGSPTAARFSTPSQHRTRFMTSRQPVPYSLPPSQHLGRRPSTIPPSQQLGPYSFPPSQQLGPYSFPPSQHLGPCSFPVYSHHLGPHQPEPYSIPPSHQPGPWSIPPSQQLGPYSFPPSQQPGPWNSPPIQQLGQWSSKRIQ